MLEIPQHTHLAERRDRESLPLLFAAFELDLFECHLLICRSVPGQVYLTIRAVAKLPQLLESFVHIPSPRTCMFKIDLVLLRHPTLHVVQ